MAILSKDHEFKSCEHEKTSNDRNKVNYIQKKKNQNFDLAHDALSSKVYQQHKKRNLNKGDDAI